MITTTNSLVPRWHVKKERVANIYDDWMGNIATERGISSVSYNNKKVLKYHRKELAKKLKIDYKSIQTHHVIPKCLKPNPNLQKLVFVTDNEHRLAHFMLMLSFIQEKKLDMLKTIDNFGAFDFNNPISKKILPRLRFCKKTNNGNVRTYMTFREVVRDLQQNDSTPIDSTKLICRLVVAAANNKPYFGFNWECVVI